MGEDDTIKRGDGSGSEFFKNHVKKFGGVKRSDVVRSEGAEVEGRKFKLDEKTLNDLSKMAEGEMGFECILCSEVLEDQEEFDQHMKDKHGVDSKTGGSGIPEYTEEQKAQQMADREQRRKDYLKSVGVKDSE